MSSIGGQGELGLVRKVVRAFPNEEHRDLIPMETAVSKIMVLNFPCKEGLITGIWAAKCSTWQRSTPDSREGSLISCKAPRVDQQEDCRGRSRLLTNMEPEFLR